ncbi:MAG: hypothetical protein U0694_27970 [Anaerolineae bacterium]
MNLTPRQVDRVLYGGTALYSHMSVELPSKKVISFPKYTPTEATKPVYNAWIDAADNELEAAPTSKSLVTIYDLGWTVDEAIQLRAKFSSVADDWDDPLMDVYDEL